MSVPSRLQPPSIVSSVPLHGPFLTGGAVQPADPTVDDLAAEGLRESSRLRARFWARTERNEQAAAQAIDQVDLAAAREGDRDAQVAVALARRAASAAGDSARARLRVYREALSAVQAGAAGGISTAAGLAVRMFDEVGKAAGPPLLDELVRRASSPSDQRSLDVLSRLVEAGADPRWAMDVQAHGSVSSPGELARRVLTLENTGVRRAAIEAVSVWASSDPHRKRCLDLEARISSRDQLYDEVLKSIVAGHEAEAKDAPSFAQAMVERVPGDAAGLRRWALESVENSPLASRPDVAPWLALLRAGPSSLEEGVLKALLEGSPATPSQLAAVAATALLPPIDPTPLLAFLKADADRQGDAAAAAAFSLVACVAAGECASAADGLRHVGSRTPLRREDLPGIALACVLAVPEADRLDAGLRAATFIRDRALACGERDVAVHANLVVLAAQLPLESVEARTAVAQTGLSTLSAGLVSGAEGLAVLGQRLAAAAETFAGKLSIARAALEQGSRLLGPARRLRYDQIRSLADAEDEAIRNSPNRTWFRAASTLAVLGRLARPCGAEPSEVAGTAVEFFDQPWAHASYLEAVAMRAFAIAREESERIHDIFTLGLIDHVEQSVKGEADPEARVQLLAGALREMVRTQHDAMRRAILAAGRTVDPARAPRIEDADEYVVIGNVRVAKAGSSLPEGSPPSDVPQAPTVAAPTRAAAAAPTPAAASTATAPTSAAAPTAAAATSAAAVAGAAAPTSAGASDPPAPWLLDALPPLPPDLPVSSDQKATVTWDTSYVSGRAGAYNPMTGEIRWESNYHGGVTIAYDPRALELKPETNYHSGVAVVFNPATRDMERQTNYHSGVAGVFNPSARQVEWRTSYHSGVAGVWNPARGQVDWQDQYHAGVAGLYDPRKGETHFDAHYKSGVGVVSTDPAAPTLSAASFPGYDDDW